MTRVGHYVVHETIAVRGGQRTLLGGPYETQWSAAADRERIERMARAAGYAMSDGAFTRLTVEIGEPLPPSVFTPQLIGAPSMPLRRPRLPYPFSPR